MNDRMASDISPVENIISDIIRLGNDYLIGRLKLRENS
jgi:hypothetical protein